MARRVGSPNALVMAATLAVKLVFEFEWEFELDCVFELARVAGTPVLYLSP